MRDSGYEYGQGNRRKAGVVMSGFGTEQWDRIKWILDTAVERPESERAAYMKKECGGDGPLLDEVASLLAAYERAETAGAFDSPFFGSPGRGGEHDHLPSMIDRRIGRFRILRLLGEGGMGSVYLADRVDGQFEQRVAIKFIRRGFGSDELRRFRAEREILGRLEHPNIARILDGGFTDEGLPFIALEYVEGSPLTEYCHGRGCGMEERLEIFRIVCDAVQYAHRNLVVHRDIKPSNILVNSEGRVKLLDFGIAKLTGEEPSGAPTRTGLRALTPEYASPEQVRGETVTTASDVYSLGALLYELLTGCRPHPAAGRSLSEIVRMVCDEEPAKPSTAITARSAPSPLRSCRRRLSGDLDTIVLKALRKEPERRYPSVEAFSEDIRRHLAGLPVLARPDTARYRVKKFAERHKVGVAAAAIVVLTLAGGIAATLRQAAETERRASEVRSLSNALLFELHDAVRDLPGGTLARQALVAQALKHLDVLSRETRGDEALEANLAEAHERVGEIRGDPRHPNLGDLGGAEESYRTALALREGLMERHPSNDAYRRAAAETRARLAVVLSYGGDNTGAAEMSRSALELSEPLAGALPDDAGLRHERARTRSELGWWYIYEGDTEHGLEELDEAERALRELALNDPDGLEVDLDLVYCLNYRADGLKFEGNEPAARKVITEALALATDLDRRRPDHPRILDVLRGSLWQQGELLASTDPDGALIAFSRSLAIAERQAAADPADRNARKRLGLSRHSVGKLLAGTGRPREAIEELRNALEIRRPLWEEDRTNASLGNSLAITHIILSEVHLSLGESGEALRHGLEAVRVLETAVTDDGGDVVRKANLAVACSSVAQAYRAMAKGGEMPAGAWRRVRDWSDRGLALFDALADDDHLFEYYRSGRDTLARIRADAE